VAQVLEYLPGWCEILNSKPVPPLQKKKKKTFIAYKKFTSLAKTNSDLKLKDGKRYFKQMEPGIKKE
jgi:hypothetical protein